MQCPAVVLTTRVGFMGVPLWGLSHNGTMDPTMDFFVQPGPHNGFLCSTWTPQWISLFNLDPTMDFFVQPGPHNGILCSAWNPQGYSLEKGIIKQQ